MKTKSKTFDAVAESRLWKEEVAQETVGMSREQILACFDKETLMAELARLREVSDSEGVVREKPPRT